MYHVSGYIVCMKICILCTGAFYRYTQKVSRSTSSKMPHALQRSSCFYDAYKARYLCAASKKSETHELDHIYFREGMRLFVPIRTASSKSVSKVHTRNFRTSFRFIFHTQFLQKKLSSNSFPRFHDPTHLRFSQSSRVFFVLFRR